MAKPTQPEPTAEPETPVKHHVALHVFAQAHAIKFGVELMGGFVHAMEKAGKVFDTVEGWEARLKKFAKQEVK